MSVELDFNRDPHYLCVVETCPNPGWMYPWHVDTDEHGFLYAQVCHDHWQAVFDATSLPLRCNCVACHQARESWLNPR